MVTSGEEPVNELQQNLECPWCKYNLRGLRGNIVSCPECGETCDVAKLMSLRLTKPWQEAPGTGSVFLPSAWLMIGLLAACAVHLHLRFGAMGWIGVMLITLVGWVYLMSRAWRVFESAEGIYLAFAGHAVLAGYMFGVPGFLVCVLFAVIGPGDPVFRGGWGVAAVAFALLLWQCHRAEAFIGKRCLRRYLAKQT